MALTDPIVTNAPGNVITQNSINAGIQAILRIPADTQYGDLVEFHWGDLQLQRAYTTADFPNYTWVINIIDALPQQQALVNGTYNVYYTITDYVGNTASSTDPNNYSVEGSDVNVATFPAPTAPAIINQQTWEAGFNIIIPAYSGRAATDIYTLFLRANEVVSTIKTGAVGDTATTTVNTDASNAAFAGLDGLNGFIYYQINAAGTGEAAGPLKGISASKQVYIDVVPPGGA
ncbi:hypothetical protein [Martelella alba]|uniref:Uncharacterized protein n=1 Tax=Martelella alba TaxID=2590451 RepID=A0ABY2SHP7_9HYPH|nr:hypothetical protein [Martelella alba]TKI04852.1 hypothetical protein FCN80_16145 [Martelella alba]